MNNHPATFSIHLLEDAEGNVRVVSDWSGEGERCLSLGIEIMQSLDKEKFTDVTMIVGSDRVKEFEVLLNKYNGQFRYSDITYPAIFINI